MSDTSEEPSDRQSSDKDDGNVCRDFVRGICDRKYCKFKHESEIRPLNFCHDFQNSICPRPNCKFIHCTPDEVEEYKRSGEMSHQILAEATRKNQLPGTPPVCNQFKKGLCRRTHCKFRHVTREQEEQEILELIQINNRKQQPNSGHESHSVNGTHRRNGVNYDWYQDSGLPLVKRRLAEELLSRDCHLEPDRSRGVFKGYFAGSPPPGVLSRVDARTLMLEEENHLLHQEIAQLKKQVQDLTATNEFLLDQNANLRVSSKQNVPAVTLTSNNQPPQVIRTVTASVATVPVSLATVTTGTAVSGNPVSITGCPTVSIASPAQILAPSQQILVTTNPGQLALANAPQQQYANVTNVPQQSQPQQLALAANTTQQLTVANVTNAPQQQQLALAANTTQQLTVANVPPQQLTLTNANPQLLQSNLAATNQITAAINTSQAISYV